MILRTKTIFGTCAAMLMGFGSLAAQDKKAEPAPMPAPKPAPAHAAPTFQYAPACCDTGCGGHGGDFGIYAEAEALFLRYHRADGVRFGTGDDDAAEFDFEISPRLTIGASMGGLGGRIRWWNYDESGAGITEPDSFVSVDATVVDIEGYSVLELNDCWSLEVSGGIRFAELEEVMFDADDGPGIRVNDFDGWGAVAAVELRYKLGESCGVFARTRGAILMGDKNIFNDNDGNIQVIELLDTTQPILEITLGVEYATCLGSCEVFVRAFGEWQHWFNYSSTFEDTTDNQDLAGNGDVGFGGFGFSVGVRK